MIQIQPEPARMRVTMGVARVGVRDYFTMEHLWNARHMAQLCGRREAELVDVGFRGIDREVRAFALGAVLESVAFLEALVNSVWQDAEDDDPELPSRNPHLEGLSDESIGRLRQLWRNDRIERSLATLDKYQVALTCVDQPPMNLGEAPGQIVAHVIRFRNDLVHFKPKMQWSDEVSNLERGLRPRLSPNPLLTGNPWFPHHMLSASGANLAYEKSREFAENWWERMGFGWDTFKDFDEMVPQIPSG
ncbi:hypothetical protein BN000_01478 [Mycobacterium rhizamassiliense]|uniref:Uncharacterized protein n=1 Tax=Mycobacterium rhizamassiliense TaxID=1841860 RepID=A0A2U3NTC3_9MYCO|nr:hypothetical protein [Mycobacterium rhizamassiliense]SPM34771.1 hypothetical protein BN000_01478 [Mycobacterium rhizamassiliense]